MNSNRRVGSLIKASREAGVRDSEYSVHFHTTSKMWAVCLRVVVVAVFVYNFFIVAMVYSK